MEAVRDSTVKLECVIQSEPTAAIKWMKEGRPVFAGRNLVLEFDARTGTASMMIPQAMPRDAGKYSIEAKNKHGAEVCGAELKVVEGWIDFTCCIDVFHEFFIIIIEFFETFFKK